METDLFAGVRGTGDSLADRGVVRPRPGRWPSELPARPGLSARIQQQITGGPDGDVSCHWVLEDGRPTSAALGTVDAPDVTLTLSWSDAAAIQRGALDPERGLHAGSDEGGRVDGRGHGALPAAREPECQDLRRRMAALTEF